MSNRKNWILPFILILFTHSHYVLAGGVALGATRLIYPAGAKQVTLPITNTDSNEKFLIQSWISKKDGSKSLDFVLTPPLFSIMPKKENTLRIMYTGVPLPLDRESIFYLNSKAIPAVSKESIKGNNLQIATQSIIKVFMRPKNLPTPSSQSPETLRCEINNEIIKIKNPSPYYVSIVQLTIGKMKLQNTMVPPKSDINISNPSKLSGQLSFQTINDYGAITPKQLCQQ